MGRDSRFDVLFEPVKIGPVTAPNRFYQVPHCTGMGYGLPATLAAMRGVKAEGGWGVVNTEYCSIDPSSDDMPAPYASLWDDGDVRNMAAMTEAVHAHGALAGVELWHGGLRSSNLQSRQTPLGPESFPVAGDPWQCARMDLDDIRAYRAWHRMAVRRARQAGFDIIYVYAAHTYLLAQFLDRDINQRTDDYGGALVNRSRLLREVIADTRDEVGDAAAVAIRIEVDNEDGSTDGRDELLSSLAYVVDLFNVTIADYSHEMGVSRFIKEATLEGRIAHVRSLTGKPVVSVGRFTSPETMLSQVKRGIVDLVGAARPSIADPFLPAKIRDGREEDIRECIGCNICYACDGRGVAIRCTQNPTMGEEWRRGWHPERIPMAGARKLMLVVGAGPAGLEAALSLARRGHEVKLAESGKAPGGRLNWETRLPGLVEWGRVRDWRLHQIGKLQNIEIFRGSHMTADDVVEYGADHVVIATGARWRRDGRGRSLRTAIPGLPLINLQTPEELIADPSAAGGPVVVFDDDHYYVASAIAEHLVEAGHGVTYVTSAGMVSAWSNRTAEQARAHARLIDKGVDIVVNSVVPELRPGSVVVRCVFSDRSREIACGTFVPVTSREPDDDLWRDLRARGVTGLSRIGDCRAPGLVAHAVYDGHRFAREFGEPAANLIIGRERPLA
ncbi:MAG: FAD-dependent oxidoreductase [Alphaproteobacteria bacterium]|nr:FAD-dependent oxidoreductase [Alphaproteobacteria bacterium]